jgi:hypothetical protein
LNLPETSGDGLLSRETRSLSAVPHVITYQQLFCAMLHAMVWCGLQAVRVSAQCLTNETERGCVFLGQPCFARMSELVANFIDSDV